MPETDDAITAIAKLFDLGGVVVVTAMLWLVWRRLTELTDRLIEILVELRLQSLVPKVEQRKDNQT